MPDCFISYTHEDEPLARLVNAELTNHDLEVFLAPLSISLGEEWSERTLSALRASSCILFLATRKARNSPFVNQELGGALLTNKRVIPVVVDITPDELPGFLRSRHAETLSGTSTQEIRLLAFKIASIVKGENERLPEERGRSLVTQGAKLLKARAYEDAIDSFSQSLKIDPLAPAANYYLALALLQGRRPSVLRPSEADAICRYVERACTSDRPQAHYFYLWALVKHDFYEANHLLMREPSVEDLLASGDLYPPDRDAINEMLGQINASDLCSQLRIRLSI